MNLASSVDAAIAFALGERVVGCVVLVNKDGERVYERAAGYADREAGVSMQLDALFRLASVTKPITATVALRMTELGLLSVDDPVTRFLPWFKPKAPDGSVPPILVRHLLTHTSGLTYDLPPNVSAGLSGPVHSLEQNLRNLADTTLAFSPGEGWAYGMSTDVLGGIVAAVAGATLEQAMVTYVTGPLQMADTHFFVTDTTRLTTPYADGRPPVRMTDDPQRVAEPSGYSLMLSPGRIFNPDAPQSGGGGTAGTARDAMSLLEVYQGHGNLLRPDTIREALTPRYPYDTGKSFCYIGAIVADQLAARSPCPVGTVDWGGAWGHNWVLDPVNRLTIVTCTNTAFEGVTGAFRDEVTRAVYAGIAGG